MIPKFDEIMLPLLKMLGDDKEHQIRECIDRLSQKFQLTDEEKRELLPSGKQPIFNNRVGWARTYLLKAGLIESPSRGYIKITERGKKVLEENLNKLDEQYLMRFDEFNEFINKTEGEQIAKTKCEEAGTPEEIIENQFEILKANLKEQLMEKIMQSSPQFFERLVIDLIVKMGYGGSFEEVTKHLGRSGDEGIDGVIKQDPLGLDNVYIQAKRWSSGSIGRPLIQSFVGALHGKGARKGIFITTSKFSNDAIDYSNSLKDMTVVLIDGDKLLDYMIQYNIGVQVNKTIEFKKIDFDYFEGE
ncbi:MAG: restriction endonuclease [Candidatus Caldatribacteriota bacterium]